MSHIQLTISQSRGYEQYQLTKSKEYRNLFVNLKLRLKTRYEEMSKASEQKRELKITIKALEAQKEQLLKEKHKVFNAFKLLELKRELATRYDELNRLETLAAGIEENIQSLECHMFDMVKLGDMYLSTHQKIQLLGGGVYKAKEIIECCLGFERCPSSEDIPFIDLVMHHTEYQWNQQRSRDWIECELWEMPVFQACMEEMIRRTHDYEKQTGRCIMTELMEEHAKENGKKLVPLQTEIGTVLTFEEDIESKYECDGKVITLKSGNPVTIYKK